MESSNTSNARIAAIAHVCMPAIVDQPIESIADKIVSSYPYADISEVRKACVDAVMQQITDIAAQEITAEMNSVAKTVKNI